MESLNSLAQNITWTTFIYRKIQIRIYSNCGEIDTVFFSGQLDLADAVFTSTKVIIPNLFPVFVPPGSIS